MKKHLVIGLGEVGTAIQSILKCDGFDKFNPLQQAIREDGYSVIHICFPFSDTFTADVEYYQNIFKPELTIIHSTVPLGTSDSLGAVHSPVRGVHPKLEQGIRTFVKFFGGAGAMEAAKIFREKGIRVMCTIEARDTEALKLWDTTIYGVNILIEKAVKAYCERNEVDFDIVYTMANRTYNEGYDALGHPEYKKYVLKDYPGPIGGHCVRENWELLEDPIATVSKTLHRQMTGE